MDGTSGTAIVAIPSVDDYVWNISSETIPHMTLLFLGDQSQNPKIGMLEEFLQHAVKMSLTRFGMDVDRRGELGPDQADVLFFGEHGHKKLNQFRSYLLANDTVLEAYNSIEQYEEWTPHLTLGYPATPAKPDTRDYPGLHWISFDMIALWVEDFKGSEFRLENHDLEMSMSGLILAKDKTEQILTHFGTKGMHWGVRRSRGGGTTTVSVGKGRAKLPVSDDALKVSISKLKIKTTGSTDSLTTKDFQDVVNRMNLEQQYGKLVQTAQSQKKSAGSKFVSQLVSHVAKDEITRFVNGKESRILAATIKSSGGKHRK